ncbi:MAG: [FeFe] hydrogenase H-cluster maturation GTPase HydF [Treponema sp.]|jgi:[FeFe] hydrogenase H-cluster maturation GTPase HydF|nr:[FeFe] hydrogenase H-cluster maturation GTPase HydF [Treponema sp.]
MGLNDTPSADRVHIGFFGCRNAGKSSLVNAVTGQDMAVVSEIKGTTTDPVYKAMELLPLGPVMIIDTPGIDDEGALGELRIARARKVLNKTDIAVLVIDGASSANGKLSPAEEKLMSIFKEKDIPFIIAQNKYDLLDTASAASSPAAENNMNAILPVSAKTGYNINALKEKIAALAHSGEDEQRLIADLIRPSDFVVLVIPIDKAAPKGRLILPQQQVIRGILEAGAVAVTVRETGLRDTLAQLGKKPALVITDSQVFAQVSADTPPEIPLTSFSILFARYRGWLETAVLGAAALDSLQDGDKILICEGCTHHRQCEDIGTVKIPRLIRNHSGKEPEFCFCSGGGFPDDLSPYAMIIHCGACMLNEREMQYRQRRAGDQHIPFTNYGITIAHIQGILRRSIAVFAENGQSQQA